jgi:hypothetical protein
MEPGGKEPVQKRLEEELRDLHFSLQEEVMDRTFPKSVKSRLKALWNKELRLPLLPAGLAAAGIIAVMIAAGTTRGLHSPFPAGADRQTAGNGSARQLIEAAGSTYWKLDYEKAVASLAHNR